jgi:hypothetical protein
MLRTEPLGTSKAVMESRRNGLLTPCVTSERVYVELCPGLHAGAPHLEPSLAGLAGMHVQIGLRTMVCFGG